MGRREGDAFLSKSQIFTDWKNFTNFFGGDLTAGDILAFQKKPEACPCFSSQGSFCKTYEKGMSECSERERVRSSGIQVDVVLLLLRRHFPLWARYSKLTSVLTVLTLLLRSSVSLSYPRCS